MRLNDAPRISEYRRCILYYKVTISSDMAAFMNHTDGVYSYFESKEEMYYFETQIWLFIYHF